MLENASSNEHPPARKRRRLARGVQSRHAQDMSLVTPQNVHLRPQWRVTPLGRLIRPMRMRPARPLGPPLDALSKAAQQSLSRGKLGKQKEKGGKRRAPPTRAHRQTIDPLRWGSTHVSGVFLDGGHAPSPLSMSAVVAGGRPGAGTNGDSTEVEEVEEILDATQSPTDDHDDPEMMPRSEQASPRSSVLRIESTGGADLAAENARTLQLLNSMFGEANEDWGGAESIDSDMEQAAAAGSHMNAVPDAAESSHSAIAKFEVIPAAQRRADNKSSVERRTQQPSTNLKDLFAPREEEGFSLIGHLDLDSELDLDLDEPAFANNAPATTPIPTSASASGPTITRSAAAAPPPPTRAQRHQPKGLDATLPFFFPHTKGRDRDHLRGAVEFGRTEDEGEIRARWESVRGELTREWKRRHREAFKSSRRRRGAGGERAE